jgi:hypothetical protein
MKKGGIGRQGFSPLSIPRGNGKAALWGNSRTSTPIKRTHSMDLKEYRPSRVTLYLTYVLYSAML